MFPVLSDAGCVGHDVGDVVLLVDPVQQVSQGAFSKHGDVFSSVGLHAQRYGGLGLVVVFLWKEGTQGEDGEKVLTPEALMTPTITTNHHK